MMKFLALIFSLFILASCSGHTSFLFDIFDEVATSKVDDYFDLNASQKSALKKGIQQDVEVIRKTVLPEVSVELKKTAAMVDQKKFTPEMAAERYTVIQDSLRKIIKAFKDTALKTTANLNSQQLSYFEKQIQKDIQKIQNENEDTEKSRKTLVARYKRSLKFWIGSVTDEQEKKLQQFAESSPYPWQLEIQSKEKSLKDFLKSYESPTERRAYIERYFNDFESIRSPEYTAALNAHKRAFRNFFATDIWPTLTQKQKTNFKENLEDRAGQIQKISHR